MKKIRKQNKGQIWIETVIYTLIGLALIALVLTFLMPRITQARDRLAVEQAIDSLNVFDQKIQEVVKGASGSVRIISSFKINRGTFIVNSTSNDLFIILEDLKSEYSEQGSIINYGRIKIKTEKVQKNYKVVLELESSQDIKYKTEEKDVRFSAAATPFRFSLTNANDLYVDFEEISGR